MDLKKIDTVAAAEKGFTYKFVIPAELTESKEPEETDIEVDVCGAGSKQHKLADAEYKEKLNKFRKVAKEQKLDQETIEKKEGELLAELVAKCVRGWKNVELDGEKVEFSVENATKVFVGFPLLVLSVFNAVSDLRSQLQNLS